MNPYTGEIPQDVLDRLDKAGRASDCLCVMFRIQNIKFRHLKTRRKYTEVNHGNLVHAIEQELARRGYEPRWDSMRGELGLFKYENGYVQQLITRLTPENGNKATLYCLALATVLEAEKK